MAFKFVTPYLALTILLIVSIVAAAQESPWPWAGRHHTAPAPAPWPWAGHHHGAPAPAPWPWAGHHHMTPAPSPEEGHHHHHHMAPEPSPEEDHHHHMAPPPPSGAVCYPPSVVVGLIVLVVPFLGEIVKRII